MNYKNSTMRKMFVLLPALALSLFSGAQDEDNLVTNGSFESLDGKVKKLGQIKVAEGWSAPTGVPADLFVGNAKMPEFQAGENEFGRETPKDGDNYAGIVVYSYNNKMKRTYVMTKLNTSMKKGTRYKVEFSASLAELSKYSSNKLAAHFSKKAFGTDEKVDALVEESHVMHPNEQVFQGMYNWDRVCGEYVAKGGEKYITIGNFTNNNDVKYEKSRKPKDIKGSQIIAAYYYIDDVSVTLLEEDQICECNYEDAAEMVSNVIYQKVPSIDEEMSLTEKFQQEGVWYAYGRYDVTPAGDASIKTIVSYLKENPNAKVELIGNMDQTELTNSIEEDPSLANISMKRAEYVRSLLINYDIAPTRILLSDNKAQVPSKEIDEMDGEEMEMAKNRRVEFILK